MLLVTVLLTQAPLRSDIKGSGNIAFDANSDGNSEAFLNSSGLGIGTLSPSANLHVQGNAFISGNTGIGTTAPTSSLQIAGTWGFSTQSSNASLTASSNSLLLMDSSVDDPVLTLPAASSVTGRTYMIKKTNKQGKVLVRSSGNIDGLQEVPLKSENSGFPSLIVVSDGTNWNILGGASGLDTEVVDSVKGWWRFSESSGNIASDSGASSYTGGLQGGMTFSSNVVAGRYGNALVFDGTDDFVQVNTSTNLAFTGQQSFSISAWVYFQGATNVDRWIVQKGDNYWLWYKNDGTISFGYDQGGAQEIFKTLSPTANRWYHIVGVHDSAADTLAIYSDNVQLGTTGTSYTANLNANDGTLTIGRRPSPTYNYFLGRIDDVRIFNKAISATERYSLAGGIDSGLVGYWKFNDTSGSTATDSALNDDDGTLLGGATFSSNAVAGKIGRALVLNGTGQYVTIPNESKFDFTSSVSVSLWIKVASFTKAWQSVVTKGDSTWRLMRDNSNNALAWYTTGTTTPVLAGSVNVNNGAWHHVVAIYNGSTSYLYVDNALDTSVSTSGTLANTAHAVWIGNNAEQTAREFDGTMDDVRIYGRALSATEVSTLYQMGQ